MTYSTRYCNVSIWAESEVTKTMMTETEVLEARRQVVLAHDRGDLTDGEYRLAMALVILSEDREPE